MTIALAQIRDALDEGGVWDGALGHIYHILSTQTTPNWMRNATTFTFLLMPYAYLNLRLVGDSTHQKCILR